MALGDSFAARIYTGTRLGPREDGEQSGLLLRKHHLEAEVGIEVLHLCEPRLVQEVPAA